jgi:hypothetical protein
VNDDELRQTLARIERHLAELAKTNNPHSFKIDGNWIPLKTAAIDSNFSMETIRLWAVRGLLAAKRIGGKWFVDRRALEEYLRCRER